MKDALKILSSKKLGFLLVRDKKKLTKGIITDGELRRFTQKNQNLHNYMRGIFLLKKAFHHFLLHCKNSNMLLSR